MNNILILRKGIDDSNFADKWAMANLVICIHPNGDFEVLKNRNGSDRLKGKCGELLDTNVFLENDIFKKPPPVNVGADLEKWAR